MFLDRHCHDISMTGPTQGNPEECNLSLLVSAKGTWYFEAEKVKQDNVNMSFTPSRTIPGIFSDIFSLVCKKYSYNINAQEVFFRNFDCLMEASVVDSNSNCVLFAAEVHTTD